MMDWRGAVETGLMGMIGAAALALAEIPVAPVGGQMNPEDAVSLRRDAVITPESGFLMLPAKPVLRDVDHIFWGPGGRHLVAVTRSVEGEVQAALQDLVKAVPVQQDRFAVIVDPKRMTARPIAGIDGPMRDLRVQWPEEGDFCVVEGRMPSAGNADLYRAFVVDLRTAQARLLAVDGGFNSLYLEPFGKGRTLAFLQDETSSMVILDSTGKVVKPLPGYEQAVAQGWMFSTYSPNIGMILAREDGRLAVLMPSGAIQPLDRQAFLDDVNLRRAALPRASPLQIRLERARQGYEAWLEARNDVGILPRALVCGLVETAALSPANDAVAYTSQRMLWLRPIKPLSGETAVQMAQMVEREEAMRRARMIGLATAIYSTDYDDCLPAGNIVEALMPYAKDRDIFSGFVFTFQPGLDATKIDDPSTYALGYFELTGGRVVTFADTSVRWVPNK